MHFPHQIKVTKSLVNKEKDSVTQKAKLKEIKQEMLQSGCFCMLKMGTEVTLQKKIVNVLSMQTPFLSLSKSIWTTILYIHKI